MAACYCDILYFIFPSFFKCQDTSKICDKRIDCLSKSDESIYICGSTTEVKKFPNERLKIFISKETGLLSYEKLTNSSFCPDTHFFCPHNDFCIPLFMRCNGIPECTYHEDEQDCDDYVCPNMYRCQGSTMCLHPSQVCDGFNHCSEHDDELLCNDHCPEQCQCFGMQFICSQLFDPSLYHNLKYLDAKYTNITLENIKENHMLVYLDLSMCQLQYMSLGKVCKLYYYPIY